MWRYVLKRLLQAIPTVVGVVLITFILFNVVGGSPAATVLGQHADARSLAEYEAARGYDKPLFCGNWTATRALEAVDFETAPPGVRARWGAGQDGWLRLEDGEALHLPLAFLLPAGERWRLTVAGRGAGFPQHGSGSCRTTQWKKNFHTVEKNGEFSTAWKFRNSARRAVRWRFAACGWSGQRVIFWIANWPIMPAGCCGWISARVPA